MSSQVVEKYLLLLEVQSQLTIDDNNVTTVRLIYFLSYINRTNSTTEYNKRKATLKTQLKLNKRPQI